MSDFVSPISACNATERAFLAKAAASLPLDSAQVERNEFGLPCFHWKSACPDVEALWIYVRSSEVTVATRVAHTHYEIATPARRTPWGPFSRKDAVQESVAFAASVLAGEIASVISYGADGSPHSSGFRRVDELEISLAEYREVFGPAMSQRAWNWFGEIKR